MTLHHYLGLEKVLTSDSEQGITTSTERYLFRGFLDISNKKVKASKVKGTGE